ncbi:MAG: peptidylprolyl isomerase [Alphaproteobacteria bacterium]|nr:peptidylprolyl isomerase [Alphaproteobacteria bacterium]
MFNPKKALLTSVLLSAFLAPFPAIAEDDLVVARVNGSEIHKSDVMRELAALPPQLQQVPVEQIYPQLLDRMIDAKLLLAQGIADKVSETAEFKERSKRAEERIITDLTLREKIKPMVTDDKVKNLYNEIVKKSPPEEEVKARHILVANEKDAKDIIEQLNKGGDFNKLAAEKSTDTASAKEGGDLGYFTKKTMVPAFADAAFALKNGEYTKTPVKTEFGYHVIKVDDKRKAEPVKLEKIKAQLEAKLNDQMANEYVEGMKKKAKIERFNLDGKPLTEPKPEAAPAEAPKKEEKK